MNWLVKGAISSYVRSVRISGCNGILCYAYMILSKMSDNREPIIIQYQTEKYVRGNVALFHVFIRDRLLIKSVMPLDIRCSACILEPDRLGL